MRGLFTQKQDLVARIESDRERRKKGDEPILITIQGQSTSGLDGEFVHSQIFLDVLLRIKSTQVDKEDLVSRSKKSYEGNKKELDIVEEFKTKYSPEKAIWWLHKRIICLSNAEQSTSSTKHRSTLFISILHCRSPTRT